MAEDTEVKHLLQEIPGKTIRAKLEPYWLDIEAQIARGISHQEIIEALRTAGLDVHLTTFRRNLTLYRARKQGRQATQPASTQQPEPPSKPREEATPTGGGNLRDVSPVSEENAEGLNMEMADVLNAKKRDAFTETYMVNKKPIFGSKQE